MSLRFCAIPVVLLFFCAVTALSAAEEKSAEGKAPAHGAESSNEHGSASEGGGHGHVVHIGAEGVSTDPAEFKSDLAIYTFIVFLLLLGILWKFAWGPISSGLEKREEGIRKNIADAEQARLKAEKMLAEHAEKLNKVQDEVREILAEARRDAEHTKQEIMGEAQREADASKQRAVSEINRARDAALKDLFDAMSTQVANATEHVLGRSLTGADQDRLIEEALSQVSSK